MRLQLHEGAKNCYGNYINWYGKAKCGYFLPVMMILVTVYRIISREKK
jgi:hypothetical protein